MHGHHTTGSRPDSIPTGRSFRVQQSHYWRLRDGLVVEHEVVRDDLGLHRQLGLAPDNRMAEEGEPRLDSVVLFVADLHRSRQFYEGLLGLRVVLDDGIVVVLQIGTGRLVLHRSDRGHDARGIWPAGDLAGAAALRFAVDDPDEWHGRLEGAGAPIVWPVQDAAWGRFVLTADPDRRPIALARMAGSR